MSGRACRAYESAGGQALEGLAGGEAWNWENGSSATSMRRWGRPPRSSPTRKVPLSAGKAMGPRPCRRRHDGRIGSRVVVPRSEPVAAADVSEPAALIVVTGGRGGVASLLALTGRDACS